MDPAAADRLHIEFPLDLPISAHVDEIRGCLRDSQVVVVAGETGSGKTTQLPKICIAAGFGRDGMIGHTQPRRLAARAVATRIAEETRVTLGAEVGYAVRFNDVVSASTRIKILTDGLLLTEIRRDKLLSRYDVIIIDEAHERSLNIDFLLGYLKGVLHRRPDLRLIITSATIDVGAFSRHFHDAPIVEVSGRSFPVTIRYLEHAEADRSAEEQLLDALEDIETGPQSAARDVLVFLPGEREIMEMARFLREAAGERFEILPLYARLSAAEQQKIFRTGRKRRIVLATNVAETSLTVPNIGYVVDQGTARISRYSFRSKLQRLSLEPIAQASADQRAGRCGRVAPGLCFRLYSQEDFEGRPAYTDPEIQRTNLASVVLQMRAFGLGNPAQFPFLDPPDPRAIRDAENLLVELGALEGERLTPLGHSMARLPVDPRLARMLMAADSTRALTEVLVIVSALAAVDPRERPLDKQGSADRAHAQWVDERSDFLSLCNLWNWFEAQRQRLSRAVLRRELSRNFLSANRMHEWRALHRQLLLATRDLKLRPNDTPADYASIHQALLTGSLSLIGVHDELGNYLGPRNLKFRIFPGSGLAGKTPRWLIAGEIMETSRVYARQVAGVEVRWIEEAAKHLVKETHRDPHWSLKRGEAVAYQSVTLFGLSLAERRLVSYSRIDPGMSRQLFLLDGLVRGAIRKPPDFLNHNLELMARIREAEDKGRRRDLLAAEPVIADIYDRLLPADITTVRGLERWLRKADATAANRLFLDEAALSKDPSVGYSERDFPSTLTLRDVDFPLKYRFAPGESDDGVSLQAPMGMLHLLVESLLDWSVPGMLAGVCEQWVRSLPKSKRRRLTPIPDAVAAILPIMLQPSIYRQGRLSVALADALWNEFGVRIDAADWDRDRVDPHWQVNVQVLAEDGRILKQDRSVERLQDAFRTELESRLDGGLRERHEQAGLREFPDQPLQSTLVLGEAGREVIVYPALVDEGDSVAIRHLLDGRAQAEANRRGYARLALLVLGQTTRYLKKQIAADKQLGLLYAALGNAEKLKEELLGAAVWNCFFDGRPLPADGRAFAETLKTGRAQLVPCFEQTVAGLRAALEVRMKLVRELDAATSPAFAEAVRDMRDQVAALIPADVLSRTPLDYLAELPRYLEGARVRLAGLQGKVQRDAEQMQVLHRLSERIQRIDGSGEMDESGCRNLRFQLEEVRIGLFAEALGAKGKASPKRLDRHLKDLERDLGLGSR